VSNPPKASVGVLGGAPDSTAVGRISAPSNVDGFSAALEVAAIYDRLRKLEAGPKDKKEGWSHSPILSSVLSGIILAVFGFFLTGRLEQASKERALNIQSAQEMQQLLVKMSTGTNDEAEAAALSLTTFGRYSIPPLIENLQYAQRAVAAEHGLQALALTDPADLCDKLSTVLENRTQRYTAAGQSSVVRILGAADCKTAAPALRQYADLIKRADSDAAGLGDYQQSVRDATPSNVTQTKKDLINTFKLLHENYAF
jgi:hypothetical protein